MLPKTRRVCDWPGAMVRVYWAATSRLSGPDSVTPVTRLLTEELVSRVRTLEPTCTAEAPAAPEGKVVKSPMVGTFYRAATPGGKPFADIGDSVSAGQAICIIEAMKIMNEIESDIDGRVTQILVQNGQAVEFGQPLFVLE